MLGREDAIVEGVEKGSESDEHPASEKKVEAEGSSMPAPNVE